MGYSGMAVAGQIGSSDSGHTAVAAQPDTVAVEEQQPDCSGFDSAAVVGQPDSSCAVHMVAAERPADSSDKVTGSVERQAVRLEMIVEWQLAGYWRTSVEEQRAAHSEMTVGEQLVDYSAWIAAERRAGYWRTSVEEQRAAHSEMIVGEQPATHRFLMVILFQRTEPGRRWTHWPQSGRQMRLPSRGKWYRDY